MISTSSVIVPRLFSKRLGTVGTACAASQADSVSKIKDLLAGYDVLRFFGKDERFTSGVDAASDSMEQAKYKLTINKDGIGCGLAYVSAVCQVAVVILLGVLILNDMIPLATFMGTGTICAGVYNGLNQVSKLAVSFSASKPYFDKIIKTNSDLLLRLINDILDLSRLEANRVTLTWEECDVVQLCSKVVASVSFSRQSSDNQFLFSTSFETLRMVTDVQRMQQVIINLLSNADKFTKRGKITLDFSVNEEKQMAIFSVTDTGCGIPKEKQGLVFERFEKLNEYAQGTGLGLSICKLIVHKWRGSIWIDPDYTGGARFVFSHPLNIEKE